MWIAWMLTTMLIGSEVSLVATNGLQPAEKVTGAPVGNLNGLQSGLTCDKVRKASFELGTLPEGFEGIERAAYTTRRQLMATVELVHGDLNLEAEGLIQTACVAYRNFLLAHRWFRLEEKNLSLDKKLEMLRFESSQLAARDRAIEKLRLGDLEAGFTIDAVYTDRWQRDDQPDLEQEPDAQPFPPAPADAGHADASEQPAPDLAADSPDPPLLDPLPSPPATSQPTSQALEVDGIEQPARQSAALDWSMF